MSFSSVFITNITFIIYKSEQTVSTIRNSYEECRVSIQMNYVNSYEIVKKMYCLS